MLSNIEFSSKRVLAIGPHPDDIELGCFGTLARLKEAGSAINLLVLSLGGVGGEKEVRKTEAQKSGGLLDARMYFGGLEDTKITEGIETIAVIEQVLAEATPDIVFINSPDDTHQDHRNAAKAALSACRFVPIVLFYQTPSSNRRFTPGLYIAVDKTLPLKLEAVRIHASQGKNVYMADSAVQGLAQFLGFQIYRGGSAFEGFEIYQIIAQ